MDEWNGMVYGCSRGLAGILCAYWAVDGLCRPASTPRIWPSVWRAPQRQAFPLVLAASFALLHALHLLESCRDCCTKGVKRFGRQPGFVDSCFDITGDT